jgi:peroxisomal 3,2-trans-enoyl-CoA isomerase
VHHTIIKMSKPVVTVEYNDKIAIITIDNAKKLNALDQDGYYALATSMREVATHDEVFITLLTAKGEFLPLYSLGLS